MRTALVTGATGMLGFEIAARLRHEGWQVRALVRGPEGARVAQAADLVPCLGDLTDRRSVIDAAHGCETIFHAGAAVAAGGDWHTFHAANVQGTAHMVDAAAHTGARLVLVSSTAVYGARRRFAEPTCEEHPIAELPARDHYGRSKQEAERVVLAAHQSGTVWACVVRPPAMYGRRDRQFTPRMAPVLRSGLFPLIEGGHTRLSLASAVAVAGGAVRAGATDRAGGRVYLLVNDATVTVADLVDAASKGLGRPIRVVPLSIWAGRRAMAALGVALKVVGRRDLAAHVPGVLDMLTRDNPFTSERARVELGWLPQSQPKVLLADAFHWWQRSRAAVHTGVAS
jgi:nucleoside-diphosphate-sugar epimerase